MDAPAPTAAAPAAPPAPAPAKRPVTDWSHAETCNATAIELEQHYGRLNGLLALLDAAAKDAARHGRTKALVELGREMTRTQNQAGKVLASILAVKAEGRVAQAAQVLGGGPARPLVMVQARE